MKNVTVGQFISGETDLIRCLLISVTNQTGFVPYGGEDRCMHYIFSHVLEITTGNSR